MMIREEIQSDLAIQPGEYLEEIIAEIGMTKTELAHRMNRPAPKLSAIFSGDKAITPDTALLLEKVVGVPAHIWTGLEAEYRLIMARNREETEKQMIRNEVKLVSKYSYSDLVTFGYVAKKTKPTEKVRELQRFFGITSLLNIPHLKRYQATFRQGKGERSPEATSSWLRIGELYGQKAEAAIFRKRTLLSALPVIRKMTYQFPEGFVPELQHVLLDAGVVLVFCPHLPKTYLHGATFWLGRHKAVLMMTFRGGWSDIFWFSLFHEIGHLLLHDKQTVFLEDDTSDKELNKHELESDTFAADILIPPDDYNAFLEIGSFYPNDIEEFAHHMEIDPGIVVGRLQHDGFLENSWHNKLRTKYEWKVK